MNNTTSRLRKFWPSFWAIFALFTIAFSNQVLGNIGPEDPDPDPDDCPPPIEDSTGSPPSVNPNGGSAALRAPDGLLDEKPFVSKIETEHGTIYTLPQVDSASNKCVSFSIPFPVLPLESSLGAQNFRIKRDDPTPALFTPQSLSYTSMVASYVNSITDDADLPTGISHKFELKNQRWENMDFEVPVGSDTGHLVGNFTGDGYKVQLLDQDLNLTTGAPNFYRLLLGNGGYIDYPALRGRVPSSMMLASGRLLDFQAGADDAFDFVFADGAFRQIRSTSGLADIVVVDDFGYEIRFYTEANIGEKVGAVYVPIGEPYRVVEVRNPTGDPDQHDVVRITDTQGSYSRVYQWIHVVAADDWVLTEGIDPDDADALDPETGLPVDPKTLIGIVSEQKLVSVDPLTGDEIVTTELRDGEGELISRNQTRERSFTTRRTAIVEEIEDVDGIALTTTRDYYTDTTDGGSLGNLKSVIRPDGSWVKYDYDSESRIAQKITPWEDSPFIATAVEAKETTFDYTPVDPNDTADSYDARARTTIIKVLGEETERTYNAYYTDATTGEYTEIVERTTTQNADYGDSSSLRTTRIYYAGDVDTASAGRLKSVATPDGVVRLYSYSQADVLSDLIETLDLVAAIQVITPDPSTLPPGVVASPLILTEKPVAYKSTRRVRTIDVRGNLVREESYVHDGSNWELLTVVTQNFSDEITVSGYQLLDRIKDSRTILSQSWYGPLVAGMKDESGTEYIYDYDLIDRLSMAIKIGANGRENVIATYDRDLGAIGCGCDGSRSVTYTAGGITLTSVQKTDAVGRRSDMTNQNGYTTTFSYVDDHRVVTQTLPNGKTRITEKFLDGRIKSVTGTAVIPEYYSYTVNADGTMTTRVEIASQGSPRFRQVTYDIAGRMIKEESPAFDGSIFTREMSYNSLGLLSKQSETDRAATIFKYDALANLIRSGLDVNGDDALVLASSDRITDSERFMEQNVAGDWFAVSTTTVYPETDPNVSVEVARSKQRLSNFALATTEGDLVGESIVADVHGNETTSKIYIDRTNKTVTQITDTADSDIDATRIIVNGLRMSQNSTTVAAATVFGYDALERRISVKDPRHTQSSTLEYYTDSMQLFTHTDGAGNTTAYTYYPQGVNGAGQVASITDPLLQKSYRSYDELGRQIQSWGETDYPQEYTYNTYGELETLATWRDTSIDFATATWPSSTGGDTTTWTYQASTGLLTRKEYADGNGTDYSYDSANRLAVRTWARDGGLDTTYSYDPATGELLNVNYESADTADITYTYDRLGRQSTVTDATGTRSFTYDSSSLQLDGEALDATFYQGHSLTRSYEDGTETNGLIGRPSGYALKDSASSALSAVNYTYEPSTGRLSAVTDGTDTFTYAYEPNSNLLASLTAPQHTAAYTYEPNRNTMTIIDNQVSGSSLSKYTYTYDTLGRRDDRQQSGSAIAATNTDDFAYNARSEVIASTNSVETAAQWNPTYTFDQIGNRKSSTGIDSVTYTANELNQYSVLSASSAVNPTYDLDGNLETDGNWTYTWNGENRLINASNSSTNATIDFVYDYQGRLVKKNDNTNVEVYVYDGWNRIASFDAQTSNLTLQTSYTWGLDLSGSMQGAGGVGGLLKETSHNSPVTTLYSLFDANGNIMQKLDGAGTTAMSVDYDPFGNIISGTLEGEYGFSTKPLIDGMLMYYYGFRYYDPQRGRWPSRDPLGEYGGRNLYSMLGNNAISGFDLLGLATYEDLFNSLMYTASECRGKSASLDAKIDEAIAALLKKNKPFAKLLDKFSSNVGTFESFSQGLSDGVGNAIDVREFIQDIYGLKKPYDAMSSDEYADFIDPINSIIGKIKSVGDGASTLSTISKGDAIETTFALLSLVDLPGGDRLLAFGPKYLQAGYTGAKKGIKDAAITKFDDILSGIPFMCDCGDLGAAEGLFKQIHTSITKTSLFN